MVGSAVSKGLSTLMVMITIRSVYGVVGAHHQRRVHLWWFPSWWRSDASWWWKTVVYARLIITTIHQQLCTQCVYWWNLSSIIHHPSEVRTLMMMDHDSLSPFWVARSDWLSRITWSVREPLERANSYHVVHVTWQQRSSGERSIIHLRTLWWWSPSSIIHQALGPGVKWWRSSTKMVRTLQFLGRWWWSNPCVHYIFSPGGDHHHQCTQALSAQWIWDSYMDRSPLSRIEKLREFTERAHVLYQDQAKLIVQENNYRFGK